MFNISIIVNFETFNIYQLFWCSINTQIKILTLGIKGNFNANQQLYNIKPKSKILCAYIKQ